jgi:hypothetical protein
MPIGLRVFFRPIWEQPGGDSVLKLNPIGATNVENQESPKRLGEVAARLPPMSLPVQRRMSAEKRRLRICVQ